MDNYIITVARQFGSLGRPIAKELSELLDINYYDRDIVEETAKKMGMTVSEVSNEEEVAKTPFFKMGFPLGMGTSAKQDEIFSMQAKIIRELADKESCIIVGRCSDYVLRNYKNAIHVFINAPYEARLRNCVDLLHLDMENAKKEIQEVDKARDAYHMRYAKFLPSDFNHKNVMVDSSLFGVEGTAKALARMIQERMG